jgi:predicted transcriptional regulator
LVRPTGNQGETLNFESPGAFFGRLTERRCALVTILLGQGAMAVRELARPAGRLIAVNVAPLREESDRLLRTWALSCTS